MEIDNAKIKNIDTLTIDNKESRLIDTLNLHGTALISRIAKPLPTSITFICGDIEMLKLEPNGDIFIKGNLVENDKEIVDGLKELLECHNLYKIGG